MEDDLTEHPLSPSSSGVSDHPMVLRETVALSLSQYHTSTHYHDMTDTTDAPWASVELYHNTYLGISTADAPGRVTVQLMTCSTELPLDMTEWQMLRPS